MFCQMNPTRELELSLRMVEKNSSRPQHQSKESLLVVIGYKLVHQAKPHLPLHPDTKLVPEEAYYLVPDPLVYRKIAGQESCKRQSVKIMITRQQLELLLRNANKFQSAKVSTRFSKSFKDDFQKWGPSLASIPEVDDF